ncbi:phage tail protein [Arcobacter sp.]|uniref:phage tail protein n=1 Tax=unclassified Arcobacter TaxID=2593671 RepID=UPI003AFF6BFE
MLGMIDEYKFEMTKAQLQSISEEIDFGIVSSFRIGNYPKHQAPSKGKRGFTLSGILIMQSIKELESLRELGEAQKPVVLSLPSLPTIQVMMMNLSTNKSNFLNTGEHLEQSFTLKLERYFK